MNDELTSLDPDVLAEILRNTDKKNSMRVEERIIRKTMVELVKSGYASFLFLRDDETRTHWGKLAKDAAVKVEKRREAHRKYEIKLAAYERLSEEDRKILKLRKPAKPRI
jgi:hypothetical protein